ncbi:MAG: glucose-1-phosphate adenylyltransferase [Bacteroidota bacterium]
MYKNQVLAIILGGGQGTRLYPLTENRSKPAVPIAGKYRLVDIPISNCINSDITRMFVLTQFNSASLNRHIKNTYHFSFFSSAFVDVLAAEQTIENKNWFQGTADAVRQSMRHCLRHDFEYALILSGDQLYQMDYNEMITAHIENEAEITVGTIPVTRKEAPAFGIMKTDAAGAITTFVEKPPLDQLAGLNSEVSPEMQAEGRNFLASMGIYVFNREVLVKLMADEHTVDFGKEIIPQSISGYRVFSHPYEGYWTDIGTVASFFEANIDLTREKPKFNFHLRNQPIYSRARMLPTSKVFATEMNGAVISDGCIIHAKSLTRSMIGIRSFIGRGAVLENTLMMGSDFYEDVDALDQQNAIPMGVGEGSVIRNAILDRNVRIGKNVRIEGGGHLEDREEEAYVIKDGLVVVRYKAVIPDHTVIR